jgi:plastocyanin
LNKNLIAFGLLLVLGVVAVSGCTSQTNNTVTIQNANFVPATLNVPMGSTVTWINKGNGTQDVTSDSGLFSSGNLTNGMSYNYTFNQSGSYPYHSSINPSMTGTIVVSGNNSSSNSSGGSSSGSSGGSSGGSGIPGY